MNKIELSPTTMLYPVPTVMVSCGSNENEHNIVTIAWTGTICSDPPMCYISVRPSRHSYEIIKRNKEFVINLISEELIKPMDWCGVRSGKKHDKFKDAGLTKVPAKVVKAPLIKEAPVNIECVVKNIIPLGTHDMFLAEVVAIHADENIVEKNHIHLEKAGLICYSNGNYQRLGEVIGRYGFTAK